MIDVAVLTPDPADPSYAGQWPGVLDRLSAALATAGIKARPTPWTDHVENAHGMMDFPLVLPLIVWGYHRDHDRWIEACTTWDFWVGFKLWGAIPLTLLFAFANIPMLLKHGLQTGDKAVTDLPPEG